MGCADQPGNVEIVAARVHGAIGRGIREVDELLNGEGIHVPAQKDRRARRHAGWEPSSTQDRNHGVQGLAKGDLQVKASQGIEDATLGARQA